MLKLPHLGWIESNYDPRLAETIRAMQQEFNLLASKAGVSGTALPAPPNIRLLTVTAQNGQFNIVIDDPDGQAQPNLGLHYFVEYDTDPAFPNPTQLPAMEGRGHSVQLGNLTLFWRAYSAFRVGPNSKKIPFGAPTAVVGGGAAVPAPPGGGGGADGGGGGFGGGSRLERFFIE